MKACNSLWRDSLLSITDNLHAIYGQFDITYLTLKDKAGEHPCPVKWAFFHQSTLNIDITVRESSLAHLQAKSRQRLSNFHPLVSNPD